MYISTTTMKNRMEVPLKAKNKSTIWSNCPTLVFISEGNEVNIQKRYLCVHIHYGTIHNIWGIESAWAPVNRWRDKENTLYIHSGILFSHKEKWNSVICSKMHGIIDQVEQNKANMRKTKIMCSLSYMKKFSKKVK
jgi:hypothetical protein